MLRSPASLWRETPEGNPYKGTKGTEQSGRTAEQSARFPASYI